MEKQGNLLIRNGLDISAFDYRQRILYNLLKILNDRKPSSFYYIAQMNLSHFLICHQKALLVMGLLVFPMEAMLFLHQCCVIHL